MGVTWLTAMIIINSPSQNIGSAMEGGKYLGVLWHPNHPGRPLLSSQAIFDTREEAEGAIRKVCDDIIKSYPTDRDFQ
jgi:hypothetical protein